MTKVSPTVLIVCITVVFCFVVAAIVAYAIAVPDGGNPASLAAILLASLGSTIAALVSLTKIGQVAGQVEYLANGGGDSKHRAAIADVVRPELISDEYREGQADVDRARRQAPHRE